MKNSPGMMLRPVLLAAAVLLIAGGGWGLAQERGTPRRVALVAAIEGAIGPAAQHHVENAIKRAQDVNAEVLVLRLDTPGGLVSTTRDIISAILGSTVPVVGFVAPPGAHAASAGTYILYATHIAAMAPGTNIGAATPVQIGGLPGMPSEPAKKPATGTDEKKGKGAGKDTTEEKGSPDEPLKVKSVNDAVALIRSLAELHGRNAEWAEEAVRKASSLTARQALDKKVINLIAENVPALLAALDGRTVTVHGVKRTLATKGLTIEQFEPGVMTRLLTVIGNPNVAFLLMLVGFYGLIFEFTNPGSYAPGVIGVISLVLALYALNQLPLDYAGLALIVLGIAFMVAEAVTPTFGVLGIGGLVAFTIGAAMLIDTDVPQYQLSPWVIGGAAATSGAFLILLLGYTWRVYRRPRRARHERGVGAPAQVLDWTGDEGFVWSEGERWRARGAAGLKPGTPVRVTAVDGLTLEVEPAGDADTEAKPGQTQGAQP